MAPSRPPLTGMNARWALLGTNKQLLPGKCWQAHRRYLNKRPVLPCVAMLSDAGPQ